MTIGRELSGNPHVGGNGAIQHEIEELKMKFEPLKDNVMDTLELLKRYSTASASCGSCMSYLMMWLSWRHGKKDVSLCY